MENRKEVTQEIGENTTNDTYHHEITGRLAGVVDREQDDAEETEQVKGIDQDWLFEFFQDAPFVIVVQCFVAVGNEIEDKM